MPANVTIRYLPVGIEHGGKIALYSNATRDGRYLSPAAAIDAVTPLVIIDPWAAGRRGYGYGTFGKGRYGWTQTSRPSLTYGYGRFGYGVYGFGVGFTEHDVEALTGYKCRSGVYLFRFGWRDRVGNETLGATYRLVVHATPDPPAAFAFQEDDGAGKPIFSFSDSPDFVIGVS